MNDEEPLKQAEDYRAKNPPRSVLLVAGGALALGVAAAIGVLWFVVWLGKFLLGGH